MIYKSNKPKEFSNYEDFYFLEALPLVLVALAAGSGATLGSGFALAAVVATGAFLAAGSGIVLG